MKGDGVASGGTAGKAAGAVDARFAAVHTDPRFQRFPRKERHVEIDERFAGMFKDPNFQSRASVDKRGRKIKAGKKNDDIRGFYRLKQDAKGGEVPADEVGKAPSEQAARSRGDKGVVKPAERSAKGGKQRGVKTQSASVTKKAGIKEVHAEVYEVESDSQDERELPGRLAPAAAENTSGSSSGDGDDKEKEAADRWARMRGLAAGQESSSEEEDDEGEEEDDGAAAARLTAEWGVGSLAANPEEEVPLVNQDTHRLALVDLDWEKLGAVDILAVLRSFLPAGGSIRSVTVYPSDYGIQRMKEEALAGPQGIYRPLQEASRRGAGEQPDGESSEDDDEDEEGGSQLSAEDSPSDSGGESDGGSELDQDATVRDGGASGGSDSESDGSEGGDEVDREALRLYELSKLRYYYAVVVTDSAATAAHVYEECDGMEFMHSACKFDLRFVPDEQSFAARRVREAAAEVPEGYEPPTFQTAALQHTDVKLTWDADDDNRKRALSSKKLTSDQIREDDFKAYLASSSSSEGDEAPPEGAADRYRSLLLAGNGGDDRALGRQGGKGWGAAARGSGSSESDDDEPQDGDRQNGAAARRGGGGGDRDVDMEVSFMPGLDLGQQLYEKRRDKQSRQAETVWQAYERRRKEKMRASKALGRRHDSDEEDVSDPEVASEDEGGGGGGQDPFFQHDADVFNDPFFTAGDAADGATAAEPATGGEAAAKLAKLKKERAGQREAAKKVAESERRREAELEMLMLDDSALRDASKLGSVPASTQGQDAAAAAGQRMSKKERMRQSKARKSSAARNNSDEEDTTTGGTRFKADLADPRFGALFKSRDFAIDPTDPRFKQTDGAPAIAAAVAQKRSAKRRSDATEAPDQPAAQPEIAGSRDASQLGSMVASLKRKSKAAAPVQPLAEVAAPANIDREIKKRRKRVA